MVTGAGLGPFMVRAVAGTGAVRIGSMLAAFLVGVLLARGLGVAGYGYYALALSIVTIAGIPGEMGLSRLVTREVAAASARDDLPHLFGVIRWARRTAIGISMVLLAGLVIAAVVLMWNGSPTLGAILILGAPTVPLMTLSRIDGGALQGLHHIVRGQIPQNLLRPAFISIILVVFFFAGARLTPALAMALNSLTAGLVLIICYRWLKQRLPPAVPAERVPKGRRWLASVVPMALTEGMRVLQSEMSILLIGLITAPAAVGLFRIATATAITAAGLMTAVAHVGLSIIARLHAENDSVRLQKAVTALAWAQFAGVALLTIPLVIAPEWLIRLAFGEQFEPAATALRILAAGQLVNAIFGPNVILLNMTNHEQRVARAVAIAFGLNLILIPVLLLLWGIAGAAVAVVASLLLWNVMLWLDARRLLGIETAAVLGSAYKRAE